MGTPRQKTDQPPTSRQNKSLVSVLRGLQFRWTLLLTVFMFVLAVVGDTLIRRSTEDLISLQQSSAALRQCKLIAALAAPELRNSDQGGLGRIAERLEVDQSILYIELFSSSGKLLLQRHKGRVSPPSLDQAPGGPALASRANKVFWHAPTARTPLFVDVVQPARLAVEHRGAASRRSGAADVAGYVRVGFDLTRIQAGLSAFLQNVRYAGIVCILLMIPLAFMVVRRITAPINALSNVVSEFANGGFRVRAGIQRRDEIGQLAVAFNSMADQLSTSNDRLVKLNAELEDRVLQRTRQLKDLSERDPLTGLYNRRHLNEVLSRRFAEAERYGNDLSCMMIDLDNFKNVNDQFGHEMGDNLLALTGSVIASQVRGADVGARFGGDEFCILLPQTSAEQAHQMAERIVEKFQQELESRLAEHSIRFGISVGVAGMCELNLMHPDELIKAADKALYGAKLAGKNCIHLAEALT